MLLDRLPKQSTKYALIIGAGVGLITGGLQDVIRYKQGQRIWYIEGNKWYFYIYTVYTYDKFGVKKKKIYISILSE